MIRSDNHVHTHFSTDSKASMEDYIKAAREKNFTSLCFTDHIDYDFPSETGEPEFLFDVDDYFKAIRKLQKKHGDFLIRTGVELGLKRSVKEKNLALTRGYPFDFVIGSTHLVDDIDPYEQKYWDAYGEIGGISRYYEVTLENINLESDYDIYGHIDYIIRYCPTMRQAVIEHRLQDDFNTRIIAEHEGILREILISLIRKGKGIEINTAGFKYGLGHPNPHETIITWFKELGGELISAGSDAHDTAHLGYDFYKVPDILKRAGFSYYTEFHGRKPVQIPLV